MTCLRVSLLSVLYVLGVFACFMCSPCWHALCAHVLYELSGNFSMKMVCSSCLKLMKLFLDVFDRETLVVESDVLTKLY